MDFFILLIWDPEEVVFLWSIYYLIHILYILYKKYKNIKYKNIKYKPSIDMK